MFQKLNSSIHLGTGEACRTTSFGSSCRCFPQDIPVQHSPTLIQTMKKKKTCEIQQSKEKLSSSFTGGVHATSMVLAPVLPPPSMRAAKTSMAKYGKTWSGTPIATKQHCNTKIPCELTICDYTVIDYISIMICSGFAAKAHAINFLLIGFLFLSCYMLLRKCCLHTARLMTSV